MNNFSQWRHWAADLDDETFDRLWLALGAVQAQLPVAGILEDWVEQVWSQAVQSQELRWSVPQFESPATIELMNFSPQAWIGSWDARNAADLAMAPVRILDWPREESLPPWLAALRRTSPVASVCLPFVPGRMPGWPLRLAALQTNDQALLAASSEMWPCNELARVVEENTQTIDCDLLLFSGDCDDALQQLNARSVTTNLLVLCMHRPLASRDFAKLNAVIAATQAAGFVVVDNPAGIDLPDSINRFVEQISHAIRVDAAACLAFHDTSQPPLIGLGDDLARFTILQVAERLSERSRGLGPDVILPAQAREELDSVIPELPVLPGLDERENAGLEPPDSDSGGTSRGIDPPGASRGFDSDEADGLGFAREGPPAEPEAERIPDYESHHPAFDRESWGATSLVRAADAMDRAEAALSSKRFLQQNSYVVRDGQRVPAQNGFVVAEKALVVVRIGPPDRDWNTGPDVFPTNALPQELASWDLQVWLSEPEYLPEPLEGRIHLRRTGASTSCEFYFTPMQAGPFNGRISVLHRGRVIQTSALRGSVGLADAAPADDAAPVLGSVIQVRQNLADPDRRGFDLALVLNHAASDQPLAHAMGGNRAWLANLSVVENIVVALNKVLSKLTRTARDYAGGLDSKKGKELLRKLAEIGNYLHLYLVESQNTGTGDASKKDLLKGEFIQVVSTRSDAIVIPFEFIYEYDAPNEEAELCGKWREAVKTGSCPASCQHNADTFCPMGFWGMSKVIERHALQPDLAQEGEVGVQSEPVTGRDTLKISGSAVYACSDRVVDADLDPLRQRMAAAQIKADQASDWKNWAGLVGKRSPSLLVALAHSDGAGFTATMEIGGKTIKTIGITGSHIRSPSEGSEMPLVALLGCDMAGTGDDYANPVAVFSTRGAAAVVGTIATVLAEHSADVAARLMQGLTFDDSTETRRLGEAMRDLKRDALLDGELMPLCLVTFGDADWLISN